MTMPSRQNLRLWTLAFLLLLGAWPAFAQDIPKPSYQAETFDPDTVSLPPMDEDSLSFTPAKPEGALDITNMEGCKAANGKWQSQVLATDDENRFYELGCVKDKLKVGRWTVSARKTVSDVPKTEAFGYSWYIDGKASGFKAHFSGANTQLLMLTSMKDGEKHGPAFEWYSNGTLRSVYHYKEGQKDGSFEVYEDSCLPSARGHFTMGKPSGVWENYFATGVLMSRINYAKTITTATGTRASWAQHFDSKKGAKTGEGYVIGDPFEGDVIKVGEWQIFTLTGHPWLTLQFDKETGKLSRETLKALCPSEGEPIFEHEDAVVSCVTDDDAIVFKREYYQTGEIQAEIAMGGFDHEKIVEYHPTGEVLARYETISGVANGTVAFFDRAGKEYGSSTLLAGSGEWTRYWYTGKVREHGYFESGQKTGAWTRYNEGGTKLSEELYRAGYQHGESRTWFSNGMVDSIMPYVDGVLEGKAMGFWTFGNPAWEVKMKAGRPKGKGYEYSGNGNINVEKNYRPGLNGSVAKVKLYYPNGKLRASGEEDFFGNRVGVWELYLLNGQLWRSVDYDSLYDTESGSCIDAYGGNYLIDEEKRETGCQICRVNRANPSSPLGVNVDRWTWYNEKGAVEKSGSYKLNRMDGEWQFFYPNGKPMLKGSYKIDKAVGVWSGYFNDGQIKFEGRFENGRESGLWRVYFPASNKQIASEGRFVDGKREGVWVWYHKNGMVREKGEFKSGKESDTWISYYKTGKKLGEGAYSEGKREGLWIWWREDGKIWRESYYAEGKEIANPAKPVK